MLLNNRILAMRSLLATKAAFLAPVAIAGLSIAVLFALLPAVSIIVAIIRAIIHHDAEKLVSAAGDPRSIQALCNSMIVATTVSTIITVMAVVLALLLYILRVSGDRLIYSFAAIPLFVPDYLFGIAGHALFEPQFGILQGRLPDSLLANRVGALAVVAAIAVMKWLPPFIVAADAQIASTPSLMFEQAKLDFASQAGIIRFVILPRIYRVIPLLFLLAFLLAFRLQELPAEVTSQGAGFQAEMWASWNYRTIYEFVDFGAAAASGLLALFVLMLVIGAVRQLMPSRSWENP